MENVVFTQLSIPEIRQIFRQELQVFFESAPLNKPSGDSDQLLIIKQASELLSLSVPTIYGLVSKSQIPFNKKGKRLYFSKLELNAWVKEGRRKTISETQKEAQTHQTRGRA